MKPRADHWLRDSWFPLVVEWWFHATYKPSVQGILISSVSLSILNFYLIRSSSSYPTKEVKSSFQPRAGVITRTFWGRRSAERSGNFLRGRSSSRRTASRTRPRRSWANTTASPWLQGSRRLTIAAYSCTSNALLIEVPSTNFRHLRTIKRGIFIRRR